MADGRYLHWEELRRREHPAGIKPEVWWFGLKVYRRGICKHVPLRDQQGVQFSYVLLKAPSKYGRAFLYTETDDNDLTYFILHQIDVMSQAIRELHRYLERKSREVHDLEMRIHGITMFNVRQRALLSSALRNPHQVYTFQSHQTSWNVVYQTARTDLLHFHQCGLLEMRKAGRAFKFMPARDLERKLMEIGGEPTSRPRRGW